MKPNLMMDGYAGREYVPVEIVRETPKRYVIKLLEDTQLPGRNRRGKAGQEVYVPKYAVKWK